MCKMWEPILRAVRYHASPEMGLFWRLGMLSLEPRAYLAQILGGPGSSAMLVGRYYRGLARSAPASLEAVIILLLLDS